MPKTVQLHPRAELMGGDRVVGNPNNYGTVDRAAPAECVDARRRLNRDNRLLVMRGPAGGQAFYYSLATLRTVRNFEAIRSGSKDATTTYDVLRARSRDGSRPVPQIPTMHDRNCRRSVHELEVEGRVSTPSDHIKEELNELAAVYAPRIGVLVDDMLAGFEVTSTAAALQVRRLEERTAPPSQAQLTRLVDEACPGVDNVTHMVGEPTAHHYLISHHRGLTLNGMADEGFAAYVDTPGAMIEEIQSTWELPRNELVIAASAVLCNSLATRDTLTVAHPQGGMVNYAAHESPNGGLHIVKYDLVVPDGFNV